MTTNPSVPCKLCGKLLWIGSTSLPEPTCRACRKHLRQRLCEKCGKQFEQKVAKNAGRFCSKLCTVAYQKANAKYTPEQAIEARKASSRARKLNKLKTWDGVPDRVVFDRAYGFCQLGPWCQFPGLPIVLENGWKDPMAPEIDHIIPLSLGGIDVSENKRAAHRLCNTLRGNQMSAAETEFMNSHPELVLKKEELSELPVREKKPKPPKTPKIPRICSCEGCGAEVKLRTCPDCALAVNRHRNQQIYYTRRGLVPPEPWWAASGITEHQAHS